MVEIIGNYDKHCNEMWELFCALVKEKQIESYRGVFKKQEVVEDTDDFTVVKIYKGMFVEQGNKHLSLTPVILKDPKTKRTYHLDLRSEYTKISNAKLSGVHVDTCSLERLVRKYDPRKIEERKWSTIDYGDILETNIKKNLLVIPDGIVDARLVGVCTQNVNIHHGHDPYVGACRRVSVQSSTGTLIIDGEDKLFDKVVAFVDGEYKLAKK